MMDTFGADDYSTYSVLRIGGPSLITDYPLFLMRNYSSGHLKYPTNSLFLQSFVAFFSLLLGDVLWIF